MIPRLALVLSELRAGGAEWVVVHLASELAKRGAPTLVVSLGGRGPLADPLEAAGVEVLALESYRGYDVRALFRLGLALRRFRPTVVNVHDLPSLPYVMAACKLLCRRPVVFTAHGALYTGGFPKHRPYHRLAARGLAGLTAVSEEAGVRHCEYLGLPERFSVIRNGVPDRMPTDDQRRAARQELQLPDEPFPSSSESGCEQRPVGVPASAGELGPPEGGTPTEAGVREAFVFLAAGNIRPEKGFEDLIEAAALLRGECPRRPFVVLIAGSAADPDYYAQVLALRERLGLQAEVRLLGFQSEMGPLYAASDAFVLSSRCEGLPLVVLECMMARRPLVATSVGAVPEALADGAGLLVPSANPAQLARAMRQLLLDPTLCQRLARAARQRALEHYSIEAMADAFLEKLEAGS